MNVRVWFVLLVVYGSCRCATSESLGYPLVQKAMHLVGVADKYAQAQAGHATLFDGADAFGQASS